MNIEKKLMKAKSKKKKKIFSINEKKRAKWI